MAVNLLLLPPPLEFSIRYSTVVYMYACSYVYFYAVCFSIAAANAKWVTILHSIVVLYKRRVREREHIAGNENVEDCARNWKHCVWFDCETYLVLDIYLFLDFYTRFLIFYLVEFICYFWEVKGSPIYLLMIRWCAKSCSYIFAFFYFFFEKLLHINDY